MLAKCQVPGAGCYVPAAECDGLRQTRDV